MLRCSSPANRQIPLNGLDHTVSPLLYTHVSLPQIGVQRAMAQQFFMSALRLDASILHHHDLIRAGDGGQAVGQ